MDAAMLQSWESLAFLHWRFPAEVLRQAIAPGLELDLYDGDAWIGLVPFLLTGLRPPWLPALPWISRFPETNLRTYVRGPDGKPGVWFFTLEADRLAAVVGARATFGLPYRWAKMTVEASPDRVLYTSVRHPGSRPAHTRIAIRPTEPMPTGELDYFLTARFRLYSRLLGSPQRARGHPQFSQVRSPGAPFCGLFPRRLVYADVEHPPWPLRGAELLDLDESVFHACGLPKPEGEPLLYYSPGVDVRVAAIRRID